MNSGSVHEVLRVNYWLYAITLGRLNVDIQNVTCKSLGIVFLPFIFIFHSASHWT